MFKCSLLATTAFVVAGSLSLLATSSWAFARSPTAEPGRDRNDEFLSNYAGRFNVFATWGGSSYSEHIEWQHVAVPVTGHGQTVSRIVVKEEEGSPRKRGFTVGIYSNGPSGPGTLLAGGKGRAHKNGGEVTVSIAPTKLNRKTTYWVEETVPLGPWGRTVNQYWEGDPHTKSKAYVQIYRFNASSYPSSSSTTPWMQQSTGPWVRLK